MANPKKYDATLAKRVVRLRDKDKKSWGNIIAELDGQVTEGSARRAYDSIKGEGASSKSRPLGNVGRPRGVKNGEGKATKPVKKAPAKATAAKKPAAKKATPKKATTARKVVKKSGIRTSKAS